MMNGCARPLQLRLAACFIIVLHSPLLVRAVWPGEDSLWSAELVNTSTLCTNFTVEDVNPEDPRIWQYARKPVPQQPSFLQHVHSIFGRTFEHDGHPKVRRVWP
jgi:hypothetical protein